MSISGAANRSYRYHLPPFHGLRLHVTAGVPSSEREACPSAAVEVVIREDLARILLEIAVGVLVVIEA